MMQKQNKLKYKFILKGFNGQKEWIDVLLCTFPILAIGIYKGGEPSISIYIMGLYLLFLVFWSFIREDKIVILKNIFFIPVLIFTICSFIVAIFSPSFISSFIGFLEYFSFFLFFLSLLLLKPDKRKLLLVLFLFSFIELIICLTEVKTGRVNGTYNYATYIVIPLFLGFLYSNNINNRVIKYILMSLFLVAALLTGSRIVFLFIIALPFFLIKRKIYWSIIPILLILILLIPNPAGRRIKGQVDIYSFQRPNLWKQAVKTALERPITGWGARNYEKASLKYNFPVEGKYERSAKIAHNQFLQYFVDGGVILLFAYILIFYIYILNFKKMKLLERSFLGLILIHSLFDNVLYLPANFLLFLSILYISSMEKVEYNVKLSRNVIKLIPLLAILYLLPLSSNYLVKQGEAAFNKKKFNKAYNYFSIAESIWPIPRNTLALATVQEQFFINTKKLGHLFFTFYFYNRAMESDPLDWKIPFKTYEFLIRNKKNAGVENPAIYLEKSLMLNPKERMLYETLINEYQRSGKLDEAGRVYFEMQEIFGTLEPSAP
jgi:hypothetical protein